MKTEEIKQLVEIETKMNLSHHSRIRDRVYARAVYFKLCKEHTLFPLSVIGKTVGKHHASVIHGLKIFNEIICNYETENGFYEIYIKLDKLLQKSNNIREKDMYPEHFYRKKYVGLILDYRVLLNENRNLKKELCSKS